MQQALTSRYPLCNGITPGFRPTVSPARRHRDDTAMPDGRSPQAPIMQRPDRQLSTMQRP